MKPRPTIFLSGVSHEFGSFRDSVENEIQMKGCFAENQTSFAPDYRTVEEMLRRKLQDADAVIHIVGFRFGAEPNGRPAEAPRRSYTQMEFDIAREMQKPVYVFLSTEANVRDVPKPNERPEDAETAALQLAHREAIQKSNELYYSFKDKAELCKLVAEIPSVQAADFRADISRIIKSAPAQLIGREHELNLLNDVWTKVRRAASRRPHILTFVALGGEGKTSLVAKWSADLAYQNWPGCDGVFAWSFYSQGTREQTAASSDLFLKEALTFFGDPAMASSAQGAFDKGRRLADLVGERRALLILDGLEPLQYAPTSPTPGELKDQGVVALLKGLAATSYGLCVVTTRYSIPDLKAFWQTTAPEHELKSLSVDAGVDLLKRLGIEGTQKEFEELVDDVDGHALTLNLLGTYLRDAHAGDIRKRDLVKLEEADTEEQGGHAFRVMDAYVKSFESDDEGDKGKRALTILRLLGLFDRPATADCLNALWKGEVIIGLTEPLTGISDAQRNISLKRLEDAKLLMVNRDEGSGALIALDAHPLLREYFDRQLRTKQPEVWRAVHRRLYEHLCATVSDRKANPTLEDLQPLYQAVSHGCHAGLHQQVCDEVYLARILRGGRSDGFYSLRKLGAFGADLGAIACFFDRPWNRPSPSLSDGTKAWLLNESATRLRALGRLIEALEPMRTGLEGFIQQQKWGRAARAASNLSELRLALGQLHSALEDAEKSVTYADRPGDDFGQSMRFICRTIHANALHQTGDQAKAESRFAEAEKIQGERQPEYSMLYSVGGFQYCNLLLAGAERMAWRTTVQLQNRNSELKAAAASCYAVTKRGEKMFKWRVPSDSLLDIALDHLTLGCCALYASILESENFQLPTAMAQIAAAVHGLRQAGAQHHLSSGLLARAWLRFLTGARIGPEGANADLDEAWEIAERGPMRLHMADIYLYRPRLFHGVKPYPWTSPQEDLAAARKLIEQCGYWRRKEELEDAEAAAKNW